MEGRFGEISIERPSTLGAATPSTVAFFFSRAFESELMTANPGVLVTSEVFVKPLESANLPFWSKAVILVCEDPYLSMAILTEKFAPFLSTVAHPPREASRDQLDVSEVEIHPTAIVARSARLGSGVKIGAHCVIEENAEIGAGTVLYPGCFIGPKCVVGTDGVLFPGVTLYESTLVGNRVRIHAGSVLGSDGFGYAPKRVGKRVAGHQKIHHLGIVRVGDDVEIGANSCVDRGTLGETQIGNHAKLDNLVHIGHNAQLAEGAIICGGTCLAGNASVGKYAYIGGLTGIANRVHVGDGGRVGALTLVTKDVPPGGDAVGNPQRNSKEHFRAHALLSRLLVERRSK
jgi:UDP-3-O-[3-hydroxymyristoyl] glucosamine N-acyltransferase